MVYKDLNFNIMGLTGFTSNSLNSHLHKKIEIRIENETMELFLSSGEYFKLSSNDNVNQSTLQVYVNGLLQTKNYHYQEIADPSQITLGIGINFAPDILIFGDIVVLEWVQEQ